jgi:non-ribosomal peptide synthetase component F
LPFVSAPFEVLLRIYTDIRLQTLTVTPSSINSLSFEVNYTREVISQADVEVILDHFEAALLFLAHHPHNAVGDVNLINEKEWQRMVTDINPEGLLNPARNISELIEAQVHQTPQKIAVRVGLMSHVIKYNLMAYL